MFDNCNSLHTLRLDNCSYTTIFGIIYNGNMPTNAIDGVTRTIYCKEENIGDLVAPTNWVFSFVTEDIPLYVPGEFRGNTEITEVRTMVDESHNDLNMMFNGCTNLVSVNTEDWDTSNVISMDSMFQRCTSLTQLNLSNFDTSNLFIMNNMFDSCISLTTLNLSNWDATLVYAPDLDMIYMFYGCTALHTLRLDNCNNDTISKIIASSGFPTGTIEGITRTIYCKEENAAGLTAPNGWVFSYVD
jgi:surface protein